MSFRPGHVPAHRGQTTTTDPITDINVLRGIYSRLNTRDRALLMVATNSAFRVGDLCSIKWHPNTTDDGTTITLRVLEGKSQRPRVVPLNAETSAALRRWRRECESEYIYSGQRGRLQPCTFSKMVKQWCADAGLVGQFSGHSTRKSWVRLQMEVFHTPLPIISAAIGHRDETTTMRYCGKLGDEISKAYQNTI